MKVLMVCLGNICRSPMAEGVFRNKAQEKEIELVVDSCGTADYHVDEHPDPRSVKKSSEHGIDISNLIGRQFSYDDFNRFDIILTMDRDNYRNVMALARSEEDKAKVKMTLNYTYPQSNMDVPDPWYGGEQGFEDVFQLLDQAADAFFKNHFNE